MNSFAIELDKIHIQNIVTHKDTTFKFNPGISVVRGENGSGKSVCFSTIGNLLYGAPPLSNKKNSAKIMHNKGGRIDLFLKSNDKDYVFSQYQKGNSVGYEVCKEGKSLETHTIATALDRMAKAFPLSQDQFYSTLYLTSYRSASHVLLNGTGPQRKEFFENFFNLQHYDIIYSILRERYSDFKIQITKIDEKEDEIKRLKSELHNVDESKVDKVEKKLNKIQDTYTEYSNLLIKIETYESISDKIKTKKTLKETISEYKNIKKEIKNLRKEVEKDNKAEQNNNLYEEIEEKRNKIKVKLKSLKEYDIAELEKEYNEIKTKEEKLKKELDYQYDMESEYKNFLKLSKKIPDKFKDSKEKADELVDKIKDKLGNARSIVKKLAKLQGEKECPTCGSKLNEKEIKYLYQQANKDIEKFEKYEDIFEDIKLYYTYSDVSYNEKRTDEIRRELEKLTIKQKKIEEKIEITEEFKQLNKQLDNLPKVEYIERVNILQVKNRLDTLEKESLKLKEDIVNMKYLKDMNIKDKVKNKDMYEKYIKDNKNVIQELSEKVGKYKAFIITNRNNEKRIEKLEEEIFELNDLKSKIKIYEALINAYGPKGIKIVQINNLAELFCNQLNLYATYLFPEPIKFSARVDNNNFNILAERDKGIADVNTLSGAQSRCFQLLCVLVLLSFIPKKYKCDTLILDEMEAGLKDKLRNKLANEFLPQLLNIVKKIVIITPMTKKEFYIPNATEYKVVKDNKKVSKIIGEN